MKYSACSCHLSREAAISCSQEAILHFVQASESSSSSLGKQPAGECNAWYPSFAMTAQHFQISLLPCRRENASSTLEVASQAGWIQGRKRASILTQESVHKHHWYLLQLSFFFSQLYIYKWNLPKRLHVVWRRPSRSADERFLQRESTLHAFSLMQTANEGWWKAMWHL